MLAKQIDENNDEAMGYIVGTVEGDGYAGFYGRGNYIIGMKVKDEDFVNTFSKFLVSIGLRPRIYVNDGFYSLTVNSKALHDYIENITRKFVLSRSTTFKKMFLRGLFDSDGWATVLNTDKPRYATRMVGFANNNKPRIDLTAEILSEFGIRFNIKSRIHSGFGSEKIQYELIITGRNNLEKFSKEVGFLMKRKQDKLDDLLQSFRNHIKCKDCKKLVNLLEHQPAIKYCNACSTERQKLCKKEYRQTKKSKKYDKLYARKWKQRNRRKYNEYMKNYHREYRSIKN